MNPHPSSPADRIKRAFSLAAVTNRAMVAALALVMLGAASCSNGTDQESSGTTSEQVATSTVETSTTLGDAPTTTAEDAATTTAAEPSTTVAEGASTSSKPSKECQDLEERDDGRYDLGDAGTVVVARNGSTLELVEVIEADGWTVDVDDDDDDEVEVELRSDDGTKVEFEAEIEDGDRLEIEVCTRR
jgi:hypothetical protein